MATSAVGRCWALTRAKAPARHEASAITAIFECLLIVVFIVLCSLTNAYESLTLRRTYPSWLRRRQAVLGQAPAQRVCHDQPLFRCSQFAPPVPCSRQSATSVAMAGFLRVGIDPPFFLSHTSLSVSSTKTLRRALARYVHPDYRGKCNAADRVAREGAPD